MTVPQALIAMAVIENKQPAHRSTHTTVAPEAQSPHIRLIDGGGDIF